MKDTETYHDFLAVFGALLNELWLRGYRRVPGPITRVTRAMRRSPPATD